MHLECTSQPAELPACYSCNGTRVLQVLGAARKTHLHAHLLNNLLLASSSNQCLAADNALVFADFDGSSDLQQERCLLTNQSETLR